MIPMLLYASAFCISAILLALDQWSKFWVENNFTVNEVRPLFPHILEFHSVHNYGAAWSMLEGARWILIAISASMILAVILVLTLQVVRHPLGVYAGFFILAGGIGNLLDRIFMGYVVDMLRFPFWTAYPTFNIADVCVVTGCLLWLLYVLTVKEDFNLHRRRDAAMAEGYDEDSPYRIYADDMARDAVNPFISRNRDSSWTNVPVQVEMEEERRKEADRTRKGWQQEVNTLHDTFLKKKEAEKKAKTEQKNPGREP